MDENVEGTPDETLEKTGEFGLIARLDALIEKEGATAPGITLGIGDDTAVFRPRAGMEILVTCDSMVEGRHYLPDRISPLDIGHRAMAMNMSDIGAMGGRPLYAFVSLGLRKETAVAAVEAIYRGFLGELNPLNASILGGNITRSDGRNFIDITLIGEVEAGKAVRRSTAKAGDVILLTGFPGRAAAGLRLLLAADPGETMIDHPLVRAFHRPSHRAREGAAIAEAGLATAMIDVSDGFLGDLGHLCEESGVGAEMVLDALPVDDEMLRAAVRLGRDLHALLLEPSDDYELIITCAAENVEAIRRTVAEGSDVPVSEVGRVTDAAGSMVIVLPDGTSRTVPAAGWDHFRV